MKTTNLLLITTNLLLTRSNCPICDSDKHSDGRCENPEAEDIWRYLNR